MLKQLLAVRFAPCEFRSSPPKTLPGNPLLQGGHPLRISGVPARTARSLHHQAGAPTSSPGGRARPSLQTPPTAAPGPHTHRMITNMTRELPTKPTTNTTEQTAVMMTGMAGEMCADSSGAPSEPPLLLRSASAQSGSQLPFGSRQVLGEQVGLGSPRKIWTGDSMVRRLQLEGKQRKNCGVTRASWTQRGKLCPHAGQRAEASSPRSPGPPDAHSGAMSPGAGEGRWTSRCRWVLVRRTANARSSSPAPEIPSSPFLGTVPWRNCPQTDALSPQEQKALELRALAPQDCSQKVKSPKLTSGSRRPAQWFRGRPGPCGTLRSRSGSALGVAAQPKLSAPTEVPFLPSSVAAAHAAPHNLRRLSQAFAARTRREHWPGGGRAQGSPAPGRATPRPVPPTQTQLGQQRLTAQPREAPS